MNRVPCSVLRSDHRSRRFAAGILFSLLAAAAPASAGTLSGVVRNGTTDLSVPRQDVILIQLQGGMQPVETVLTDAQGRYTFNRPELGQAPMLVRVPYRGVNYHQNVPPGTETVDIEVYEPTASFSSLALVHHAIIVRPDGEVLIVGEEFSIHNLSKPPATFFSNRGTFEFTVPDGATLREVSAAGPAGMPLAQATLDRGKNRYAIPFALKPGENTIRVSYQLAYPGNQATVKVLTPMAAERVVLAGPAGVQVSSDGFSPAGNEQGYTFYSRDAVAANTPVVVAVSGAAPPSSASGSDARDAGSGNSAPGAGNVIPVPPRVASVQWILIAGFAALFALGVVYLWRQPRTSSAAPAAARTAGFQPAPLAEGSSQAPVAAADVNRDLRLSLDELKDTLFRLELRHQAGTISDAEYSRERSRLQAVLRDLVRG